MPDVAAAVVGDFCAQAMFIQVSQINWYIVKFL